MTAWIEISAKRCKFIFKPVAVFMTAWIEITVQDSTRNIEEVAVFMTAWIEIRFFLSLSSRITLLQSS